MAGKLTTGGQYNYASGATAAQKKLAVQQISGIPGNGYDPATDPYTAANQAQAAPYLEYYRRKYANLGYAPSDPNNPGTQAAEYSAGLTGIRRAAEANAQGMNLGQAPDLTDSFIQQAAQQQRLRQKVGVNRSGSFLAPGGF